MISQMMVFDIDTEDEQFDWFMNALEERFGILKVTFRDENFARYELYVADFVYQEDVEAFFELNSGQMLNDYWWG